MSLLRVCASAPVIPVWLLAIGAACPAAAQETSVEEIIVTATKRDTRIQDTPIAMTAVTGESLQNLGATNFNDFYRTVPSLQITENAVGQDRISIRGVYAPGEATVGLYYDETPLTGPSGTTADPSLQTPNVELFDVQRVEVLRGPQGTLYGSGSVGGTLRYIFNKPDLAHFGGTVDAQGSSTEDGGDGYAFKGVVNVPIVDDKLAARLVGYTEKKGGYIDNIRYGISNVNSARTDGGRAMLRYVPADRIDVSASVIYQKNRFADNSNWYQQFGSSSYNTDQAVRTPFKDELELYNTTLNWDLAFAKLTAVASYYKWDIVRNVDPTASLYAATAFAAPTSAQCERFNNISTACSSSQLTAYKTFGFSQLPLSFYAPLTLKSQNYEVRLASPGGQLIDWTAGIYYEKRRDHIESILAKADAATGDLLSPLVSEGNRFVADDEKQTAEFGEVSVHPLANLTITGGGRHFDYDKTVTGQVLQTGYVIGSFAGAPSQVDASASGWVEKLNIAYKLNPDTLAYAQWAEGFRPGGANNVPGLASTLTTYQPDQVRSYEVGLKNSWTGGRYTLDLAAFQINWTDMQTSLSVLPGFMIVTNAGDARIRGLELETAARPMEGLTLGGGFSWIPEAKLTQAQLGGAIINSGQNGLTGDRIPYTPKWTASANAGYELPITADIRGFVWADANYHGSSANQFRPSYVYYETLNHFVDLSARIGVRARENWSASLFVSNLSDVVGQLSVQSSLAIPPYQYKRQLVSTTPRTIGLDVTKSF